MTHSAHQLSARIGQILAERGWHLATAESCTGGGVAAAITSVPGSSAWFEYGFVSYANSAKQRLLGVDSETLAREGAVSEAVVLEMVDGALRVAEADIAVAISGIAGPGGGTPEKPVGSVWFAWGLATGARATRFQQFAGDRLAVQAQSVESALAGLVELLRTSQKTTV